jgi:hypothetical protein
MRKERAGDEITRPGYDLAHDPENVHGRARPGHHAGFPKGSSANKKIKRDGNSS